VDMTPELKSPSVEMPYEGDYTQQDYAQQMIDEYKAAGVSPRKVWAQSFDLNDVLYWVENEPRFGKQAVFLDGRYSDATFDPNDPTTFTPSMQELRDADVRVIAPPIATLLQLDGASIVPSAYAHAAKDAGLEIITWTAERDGPLAGGGGFYHASVQPLIDNDGDTYDVIDVLAKDVGVLGIFSDWPATVTYYANCANLR